MDAIILSDWLIQHLDKAGGEPAYRQINSLLQQAILSGQLPPGTKLPSSRTLASDLRVARNTVLHVYDQLTAEGYVTSSTGSGTYVADTRPARAVDTAASEMTSHEQPHKRLSTRGQQMIDQAGVSKRQWGAFMPGVPDTSEFPSKTWNRLQAKLWRQPSHELLTYASGSGYRPLRRALSDYLRVARSVNCNPDQIIITTGVHQSVDLAVKLLSDIGDVAWLEEPCYWGVRSVFRMSGLELKPIPIDTEGLNPSVEDMQGPPPRLILVTPSHQYPMGMVMSLSRRRMLLDFASKHRTWVIEDDYDSEFRYGSRPISSLQGLDTAGQVIYVGSFGKTMFPGLRMGYMVVPENLIEHFRTGLSELYREGQLMQQALLTDFIIDGYLTSHIRHMRALYGERRTLLIDTIRANFGDALPVMGDEAGLHLVLGLHGQSRDPHDNPISDERITDEALEAGIVVRPLTRYYIDPASAQSGLLLGYACVPNNRIEPAFDSLARVIEKHLTP